MPRIIPDMETRTARPGASIVSTFTRPAAPRDPAQAGRSIMSALGVASRKAEEEKRKQEAADKRKGQLEGLKLSASEDPQKIREGMYPNASESFMAGVHESMAQASAYKTVAEWRQEYNQLVKDDPDIDMEPARFQQWISQKVESAVSSVGDNEFAAAGAVPVLRMGMTNLMQTHVTAAAERVEAREFDALDAIVVGKAENHDWVGDEDGTKLIAGIAREADIRVGKGLSGKQVNNTVIDSLINVARASNDTRYLQALITAHDKGIYKLSSEQFSKVETAEDTVSSELAAAESARETAEKKARERAEDAAMASYGEALAGDTSIMPDRNILRTNPELYGKMVRLRTTLLKASRETDPLTDMQNAAKLFAYVYSDDVKRIPYAARVGKVMDFIESSDTEFSESTLSRVFSQISRESRDDSSFKDAVVASEYNIAKNFLRSEILRDGNTMPGEVKPVEAEYEGFFAQYVHMVESQAIEQGRTFASLSFAEKQEVAQNAARYAARQAFLGKSSEELGFMVDREATHRFMKRIGIDPKEFEEESSDKDAAEADAVYTAANAEEPAEEPTPAAEQAPEEAPEEDAADEGITSLDMLRTMETGVSDVLIRPLARQLIEETLLESGGDSQFSDEDVNKYATALMNAWLIQEPFPTPQEVLGDGDRRAEDKPFSLRNQEAQQRFEENYQKSMDRISERFDRLESRLFGDN